ncbi:hypothetical protein MESS4_720001 [Mesorhizobium sp. STM 4661]|nr:hypothetical protein MESS4_720001 [Mesorhizobium sp. STM 4661]
MSPSFSPITKVGEQARRRSCQSPPLRGDDRQARGGWEETHAREWWHYTLEHEPFPKQRFDFPIAAE